MIAILIVIGTFFYSNYLAERISNREKRQMEEWVAAQQAIANAAMGDDLSLASVVIAEQTTIPVIETNESDSIMGFMNLDSSEALQKKSYLADKLSLFKDEGNFIKTYIDNEEKKFNVYYYGESSLLKQVRYFPLLQLLIVILFTSMMIISINNRI